MDGAPSLEILKGDHGHIILPDKGFIIRTLFRKVMYFRI